MYPKNAAAPERIAIGPVVQISDGAVQTSGCTVRIIPLGVAEGDGGGTTAYSTDGVVLYTPTQAETNYTSFVLIAKKTGCIPAAVTVVTTASAVPGRTMPDAAYDAAKTAAQAGDIMKVSSGTGANQISLASGKAAATVAAGDAIDAALLLTALSPLTGAVNDAGATTTVFITTLASSVNDFYKGLAVVFTSGALLGQLGQIASYAGSSKTVTLQSALTSAPANGVTFRIVNVAASRKLADIIAAASAAGKVAATFGNGDILPDTIDAASIKADAVTKIQAGLAGATDQTAIKTVTDKLADMVTTV